MMKNYSTLYILILTILSFTNLYSQQNINCINEQLMSLKEDRAIALLEQEGFTWVDLFISKSFQPPTACRFICIKGASSIVDKLVLSYDKDNFNITIVQMEKIFSIELLKVNDTSSFVLDEINSLSHLVFKSAESLKLNMVRNISSTNKFGMGKMPENSEAPWLNNMYWQIKGYSVVFYFVKDTGVPKALDTTEIVIDNNGCVLYKKNNWFEDVKAVYSKKK